MGKSKRPVKLDEWGISWEEYKELTYFCLQYARKKREAEALLTLRISTPPPVTFRHGGREYGAVLPVGGGGLPSDPVAAQAQKREKLLRDVDMIERAVAEAAREYPGMAGKLLDVVTGKIGVRRAMDAGGVYCGVNQFYGMRRRFFWILKQMRDGAWEV